MAEPVSSDPSFLANTVGGGGCGCGCLGGMVLLVGAFVLIGVPLSFYDPTSAGSMTATGVTLVLAGLAAVVLGLVGYVASLFIP